MITSTVLTSTGNGIHYTVHTVPITTHHHLTLGSLFTVNTLSILALKLSNAADCVMHATLQQGRPSHARNNGASAFLDDESSRHIFDKVRDE